MDTSEYVATLRRELESITRFAGEDVTRAAEMLTDAMESSVRLTLLEVLSAAAAEITTRLDDAVIDVRLSGSDADFVVTPTAAEPEDDEAPQEPGDAGDDAGSARVTLRLSEALKSRVETEAAAAGISVNAWLVRAARLALQTPGDSNSGRSRSRSRSSGVGQRFTGYARG
jgi:HicB family